MYDLSPRWFRGHESSSPLRIEDSSARSAKPARTVTVQVYHVFSLMV